MTLTYALYLLEAVGIGLIFGGGVSLLVLFVALTTSTDNEQ